MGSWEEYKYAVDDPDGIGLDGDLQSCLQYNPQGFALRDIEKVLAVYEGENDGEDWSWILKLKDGRIALLVGGCDYTGWDCQSSADTSFHASPEGAAAAADEGSVRSSLTEQIIAKEKSPLNKPNLGTSF